MYAYMCWDSVCACVPITDRQLFPNMLPGSSESLDAVRKALLVACSAHASARDVALTSVCVAAVDSATGLVGFHVALRS